MSNTYNLSRKRLSSLPLTGQEELMNKVITNITLTRRNLDAEKISLVIKNNSIFTFDINDDIIGKNLLKLAGLNILPLSDLSHSYVYIKVMHKFLLTDETDNMFYFEYEYKPVDSLKKEYPLNNGNIFYTKNGIGRLKYFFYSRNGIGS